MKTPKIKLPRTKRNKINIHLSCIIFSLFIWSHCTAQNPGRLHGYLEKQVLSSLKASATKEERKKVNEDTVLAYIDSLNLCLKTENKKMTQLVKQKDSLISLKNSIQSLLNQGIINSPTGNAAPTPTTSTTTATAAPGNTSVTPVASSTPSPSPRPAATNTASVAIAHLDSSLDALKKNMVAERQLITHLQSDSFFLNTIIIGAQKKPVGVNVSYFVGIPALADDNPKGYSCYHASVSLPARKIDGVIKNTRGHATLVWGRNAHISFIGNFNNKNFGAHDTISPTDTIKNNSGKYIHKTYLNLLDLKQYAFATGTIGLNVFTVLSKHYHWYLDGFFSLSRTNIYHNKDSLYAKNFGQYGASLTGRTIFNSDFNAIVNVQMFWIDPGTNSLSWLNGQYNKMPYETTQPFSLPHLERRAYGSINFTLQYKIPDNTPDNTSSANASASQITGKGTNLLYAFIGYNTAFAIGRHELMDINNYLTLQVGYSTDFSTVVKSAKTLLGLK